jgi:lipopolysaccharide exporter
LSNRLIRLAGTAISWQALQHFAVQAIFLGRLIVLARLLAPADFGLRAIGMIAVGFLLRVTDFGMIPALVQRSESEERHYDAAWTVGLLRAAGISAVVILGAPLLAQAFGEPSAAPIVRALGVLPLIQAAASIKVAKLTRDLEFRKLAHLNLLEAVGTTVVSIALAARFGVWALVAGSLAGPAVYSLMSYRFARHRPRLRLDRDTLAPLVRFGRWIFVASILALASQSMLQLVISRRLGVEELGLYSLAARLAFMPSGAAFGIVGTVAFPFYSRIREDASRSVRAFRGQLTAIAVLLLPVYALIMALAPSVTEELLGAKWNGSAPIIRILAIASLIGVLAEMTDPLLKAFGRASAVAVIEGIQSAVLVVSVWFLAGRFGLPGAAAAWIPALSASLLVAVVFLRRLLDRPFSGIWRALSCVAVSAAAAGWVTVVVDGRVEGLRGLVVAGSVGCLVAAGGLFALERTVGLGIAEGLALLFPRAAAAVFGLRAAGAKGDGGSS